MSNPVSDNGVLKGKGVIDGIDRIDEIDEMYSRNKYDTQ